MQRCLARVPNDVDKRAGGIIYDALAPAVAELTQLYIEIGTILDRGFADTATGEDLTLKAKERAVFRRMASPATRQAMFWAGDGSLMDIPINSRYSGGEVNFRAVERISQGVFRMLAEQAGDVGNRYIGALLPITHVANLARATIGDVLIPGQDTETDAELRARYMESLDVQAFGGNIADYKAKTEALQGVGAVRVVPTWEGVNTVQLVIIASTWDVPSSDLIDSVQNAIDPLQDGNGFGLAPIGHIVTVTGVEGVAIHVEMGIELSAGTTWGSVATSVRDVCEGYLLELRKTWADNDYLVVRVAQFEAAVLQVAGIVDVGNTKLNGSFDNVTLLPNEVPLLGVIERA